MSSMTSDEVRVDLFPFSIITNPFSDLGKVILSGLFLLLVIEN